MAQRITVDGNQAVAQVAYRASEVVAIYPITPSSPMAELCDEWSAEGRPNLFGSVPHLVQMQSEAGVAGALHGALQAGSLCTTFTSSQGLLLMIPVMYKLAGELTSFAMHVSARAVASHALSIFGDHSDVMACRQTGFALLASGSVQEAQDLAAVAHAATLRARVPFLHFFDGFRTSHEVAKIDALDDDALRALLPEDLIADHRARALSPDRPVIRGTAQNPDTFFQSREAQNPFYARVPEIVRDVMHQFALLTGRRYHLFDYVGHPRAERVLVMMGSGAETAHEMVDWMVARGERVGLVKVRLYRPFSAHDLLRALPRTAHWLAVLDRTKEPGAVGEPLYLDVVAALAEADAGPARRVIGGRYGLSSKEFTPAMVEAVFEQLQRPEPRRHFTVGIQDDVTGASLLVDKNLDIEPDDVMRAVFWGLGADGTVGANKASVKIIGEQTDSYAQGYFVYDSKKSGAVTVSHLRFGPRPIRSAYLIKRARLVACHQFDLLFRYDVLASATEGGIFLLNAPFPADQVWDRLPREVQAQILEKRLKLWVVDAARIAREAGLGGRINTIMQTCFFALAGVLPREEAIAHIKRAIEESYARKGGEVLERNFAAVDRALTSLAEVPIPDGPPTGRPRPALVPPEAPPFVQHVTAQLLAGRGDALPVSAFPPDGTWPSGTARWEKRGIAQEIPAWEPSACIQCNKCALICPHAAIRAKVYPERALTGAPAGFRSMDWRAPELVAHKYSLQVSPDDCTGCALCVDICPGKDKATGRRALQMVPARPVREQENACWAFFDALPELDRARVKLDAKGSQLLQPLFEFSGACAGCGETPYIKLVTQLFGDRALIANATGCSSIYGGNLPTTPYTVNAQGRGPAWSNSLFEDNAEFGLGLRLALDAQACEARSLLAQLGSQLGDQRVQAILEADQTTEAGIAAQRERVAALRASLRALKGAAGRAARRLATLADALVKKSVWIVGGDGWAYDIGYGGLDHVLSMGRDVNILVLDTEVYSNTGGQVSKATPLGAAARFAAAGKARPKKDLGLLAMVYGDVYVAQVAVGAKDAQTVKALLEAESYPGTSLIIAYSHCIAHGYEDGCALEQERRAVASGAWPLYRYDPRRAARGESPLVLDSSAPREDLAEYMRGQRRFRAVEQRDPARFMRLLEEARHDVRRRFALLERMARESADLPL